MATSSPKPPRRTLKLASQSDLKKDLGAGTNLPVLVSQPTIPDEPTPDHYVHAIERLWSDAQRTFLQIGKYLEDAQERLAYADFKAMADRLPFGKAARSQLMAAYRMVSQRRLPAGIERAGYTTVYAIARLSDEERQEAISDGVIRPEMTRRDLLEWQRSRQPVATLPPEEQLVVLRARERQLKEELASVRKKIAELREQLGV